MRLSLAALVTPVRLRALPRDAFVTLGALRRYEDRWVAAGGSLTPTDRWDRPPHLAKGPLSQRLFAAEGGIWTILRTEPDDAGWRRIDRAEFTAFLAGDPLPLPAERGIARALARSPVCIRGYGRSDARAPDTLRPGEVLHDGRGEAPEALQAYLDRHVILVGDEVRVRSLGPVLVPTGEAYGEYVLETMAYGCDHPTTRALRFEPTGPRSDFLSRHSLVEGQFMAGLDGTAFDAVSGREAALTHFANVVPEACLTSLRPEEVPEEIGAALLPYQLRGLTGSVHADEAGVVADLAERFLPHTVPTSSSSLALANRTFRLRRHIEDTIRPLVAEIPMLAEDGEYLGALAR